MGFMFYEEWCDLTPVSFRRRERRAEARFAVASRATASKDNNIMNLCFAQDRTWTFHDVGDGRREMGRACYSYTHIHMQILASASCGYELLVFSSPFFWSC
jgi:hypothetical protein